MKKILGVVQDIVHRAFDETTGGCELRTPEATTPTLKEITSLSKPPLRHICHLYSL